MRPFKKILCPIDFSDPCYESLKVANEPDRRVLVSDRPGVILGETLWRYLFPT